METDDARALAEFSLSWSDLMHLEVVPVVEDADLAIALERAGR